MSKKGKPSLVRMFVDAENMPRPAVAEKERRLCRGRLFSGIAVVTALVACIVCLWFVFGPEPKYQGKPLSQWMIQLEHNDPMFRTAAAEALGNMGPSAEDAVPALSGALHDSALEVQAAAAEALGRIGGPGLLTLRETLDNKDNTVMLRRYVAESFGHAGMQALPVLQKLLDDESAAPMLRGAAAKGLGHIGPEALPILETAIKDEAWCVRTGATEAMGHIGVEALPMLTEIFRDKSASAEMRMAAAKGLGHIGLQAMPVLEKALYSNSLVEQAAAGEGLAAIGTQAINVLLTALKGRKCEPKGVVHRIDSGQTPVIIVILPYIHSADAEGSVQLNSVWNLGATRVPAIIKFTEHGPDGPALFVATDSLARMGPTAVAPLAKAIRDESSHIRFAATYALYSIAMARELAGRPEAEMATAALVEALGDKSADVRIVAAGALGALGTEASTAVRQITQALEDKSADVRFWAAHALGAIGVEAKSAVPDLKTLLNDQSEHVRKAATEAIKKTNAGGRREFAG